MTRTLVLWDIDGTLLLGGRVAMNAYNQALREVYELQREPFEIDYGGKTDTQIALEVLVLHDIAEAQVMERFDRFHNHYVDLAQRVFADLQAGIRVLPGVRDVIAALAADGAIQTLLTGNFRLTAELKLRAAALDQQIDASIGAFGSDHRDRDELVPIARAKAEARYGPLNDIVVIGDTPRDIACGRAGNARTVAVATGKWTAEALAQHHPDWLLPDLADVPKAVQAILDRDGQKSKLAERPAYSV